jgi:[glutamine synthetase] adenylyltransferase / [glutamine synthetase]-adenylyl-L-tyrosine phosphorylase
MANFSLLSAIRELPGPSDGSAAARGGERWLELASSADDAGLCEFVTDFADAPDGAAVLDAVFGNSPFLTQCLLQDPETLRRFATGDPHDALAWACEPVGMAAMAAAERAQVVSALRIARRRVALIIGLADILGLWPLETVTAALSGFAETALDGAIAHLLTGAARTGDIDLADPARPVDGSGLVVLGMGKLGGGELNYSSDIDLIVLFDPEIVDYRGSGGPQRGYVKLVRELVRLFEERTGDGYVFRTDLRLRPDPGATPVAMSVNAAENYYESLGQNWERAAMIKARPVAGDRVAGADFLKRLVPFIWRRHLDFAAIQDIHSIKRQIHAQKGHHNIALHGHDVKLGRGGIREIEFFAQTQQLIWGGREPALRPLATCDALDALQQAGRVAPETALDMAEAYRFLRRVEHRIQIVDDRQTHRVPESPEEFDALACFLGYDDPARFAAELQKTLETVEEHYAGLFEDETELAEAGNLVFTGSEDDPETLESLAALGFRDCTALSDVVRGWHRGRVRAMRSTRARELLTELMPTLLTALGKTVDPDAAFRHFNEFLSNLPSGVQLFSLFYENPDLLNLVAEIMGSAPRLAAHLARKPVLLDAVLSTNFLEPLPDAPSLRADLAGELGQARDFQDELDITRRWAHDRTFQVGVQILRNESPGEVGATMLADIADAALQELHPRVEEEFARGHGRIDGGGLAILALGKLGGREMTVESDLDLVFVYQSPDPNAQSDGKNPLAAGRYFARLSQRLLNAFSAPTSEGALYEIDMRLRPSGSAGPVASEIGGFEAYQRKSAWTWEHMALTRARVVSGPPALKSRIEALIAETLTRSRDAARLHTDVAEMRARVEAERATDNPWKTKHARGGMLDLEFIAQYLQLRDAERHPEVLAGSAVLALARLSEAGSLDAAVATELIEAARFLTRLQGLLRLTVGMVRDEARYPEDLRAALVRAVGAEDFDDLKTQLIETERRVYHHHLDIIGTPDEIPTDPEK